MAINVERYPSGFVIVNRGLKSIASTSFDVDADNELKILFNEVVSTRSDKDGKVLLHLARMVKKYLGDDLRVWIKDQIEYAKLDSLRWGFFVELCRIVNGEERNLATWRNVMTRAKSGEIVDFQAYASVRNRTKQPHDPKIEDFTDVRRMCSQSVSSFIVQMGSAEAVAFLLYVLYGQNAEFIENIDNKRVTPWLPIFRNK